MTRRTRCAIFVMSILLMLNLSNVLIDIGVVMLNFGHTLNRVPLKYLIIVGIGSSIIGVSAFLTKFALNLSDTPVTGLAFSFTTGIIVQILIITVLKKWKDLHMGWNNAKYFILSGILVSIGFIFGFLAFSIGDLIIVAPLVSVMPLFALILSHIILKKHESITKNIVIGTVFIVLGASILAFV